MKKLFKILAIMAFIVLAFSIETSAQRIEKKFVCSTCAITADTVAAETTYYSYAVPIKTSDGILGFIFDRKDVTDSCSVLTMQGAMESAFAAPVTLTGTAACTATTTDGTYFLYVTNPVFLYYRLKATAAGGDAVRFTNVTLIYK